MHCVYDVREESEDGSRSVPIATFDRIEDAESCQAERNASDRHVSKHYVFASYVEYLEDRYKNLVASARYKLTSDELHALREFWAKQQP